MNNNKTEAVNQALKAAGKGDSREVIAVFVEKARSPNNNRTSEMGVGVRVRELLRLKKKRSDL